MKKYLRLEMDIVADVDVISTSSEVTTDGIKFPWSVDEGKSKSSYQLLCVKDLGSGQGNLFEM